MVTQTATLHPLKVQGGCTGVKILGTDWGVPGSASTVGHFTLTSLKWWNTDGRHQLFFLLFHNMSLQPGFCNAQHVLQRFTQSNEAYFKAYLRQVRNLVVCCVSTRL